MGPNVRKLRDSQGLTQPMLVAKLNLLGWNISRETLAKIESQIRWVSDFEVVCLCRAFGVEIQEIMPPDTHALKLIELHSKEYGLNG